MKVRVSEATNIQLNWMVAKAQGIEVIYHDDGITRCVMRKVARGQYAGRFNPTTDWSQGGPIIETKIDCLRKRSKAEEASLAHPNPNFKFKAEIFADIDGYFCAFGPTPLIAAMRCYVASRLGEEVEVPEELK